MTTTVPISEVSLNWYTASENDSCGAIRGRVCERESVCVCFACMCVCV